MYPTFETSINLSTEYQKRFEKVNKDDKRKYFHLPRLQIILINKIIKNLDTFVYPRLKDVYVLYGEPNFPAQLPFQEIQQIDLTNLKRLKETLEKIPIDLIDRTDPFEYYNLLRRMNYIISPSPVRVLTQVLLDENPYDIWAWNTTKIIQMLKKSALDELASSYKNYYLQCWDLYTSNFRDNELFLSMLSSGWKVLCQSYDIALIINK